MAENGNWPRGSSNRTGIRRVEFIKTTILSLVWFSYLLLSPDLACCIDTDSNNVVEGDEKVVIDKTESIDHQSQKQGGTNYLTGPSSHDHLLFSNHSCSCHDRSSLFSNDLLSSPISAPGAKESPPSCHYDKSCDGRIFYLVSIHNERTLSDALYLFRAIRDARNTIVIHIDTKFGLDSYYNSPLYKEITACPCGSQVEVASVYDCKWGSWSMNLPTLWSMEKAVKEYAGRWDVYVNLSGDTLPVYSQVSITFVLRENLENSIVLV